VRHFQVDELAVTVHDSDTELGEAVADEFAVVVRTALRDREFAAVVLATGNSQLPFFEQVRERDDIEWNRVEVFHMDEYLGMSEDHPASFRRFLHERLVDHVHPRAFHGIEGDAVETDAEMRRYVSLLQQAKPVLTVMGIGENGHLAFNEPPADFDTPDQMRLITLDERSRKQQVGEGHFASLDETPYQALTLTIPALVASDRVIVVAPEARKAQAVRAALEGPIEPQCPASALRRAAGAHLHLDTESASLLSA
jgi:glucosamine-6-phosphate deaminase